MKKNLKAVLCMGMAAGMVFANTMAAFAGTWRAGAEPNQNKWWYDFDNGTYASNGWQWIDGNNDGVAECYYFDADGWMLTDTTTPDGYSVNADGVWVLNGVVQTQGVQAQEAQTQASVPDIDYSWLVSADGVVNYDIVYSAVNIKSMFGSNWMEKSKAINPSAEWQQVFDRLQIPEDLGSDLDFNQEFKYTVTTAPGMTDNDWQGAGAVAMARILLNCSDVDTLVWNSEKDENGVITITIEGRTLPMGYSDSWNEDNGVYG